MHIDSKISIKRAISQIKDAQSQEEIYQRLDRSGYLSVVLRFLIDHYNSVYNDSYRKWSKPTSYRPTDLNEASSMCVEALRWLNKIQKIEISE